MAACFVSQSVSQCVVFTFCLVYICLRKDGSGSYVVCLCLIMWRVKCEMFGGVDHTEISILLISANLIKLDFTLRRNLEHNWVIF